MPANPLKKIEITLKKKNSSPQDIGKFDLNEAGLLSLDEQAELDEIEQIEHIMIMLKARTRQHLANEN